jgi:hypothetical protein
MTQDPNLLPQVTSNKGVGIHAQNANADLTKKANADLTFAEQQRAAEELIGSFILQFPERDRAARIENVGLFITNVVAPFVRGVEQYIPGPKPCAACGEDLVDMSVDQKLRHFRRHGWMRRQLVQLRNFLFN